MLGAVDVDSLATAWLAQDTTKGLGERARAAAAWLKGRALDLVKPLTDVIGKVHADGYEVGDGAAAAALGTPLGTDWDNWRPGDVRAATLASDKLRELLDDTNIDIKSVAQHRFDDLAEILAEGIERGDNAATLAEALRGTLQAPEWAEVIAVTETARAVSRAALERYSDAGIDSVTWEIAPDQRVCVVCDANAAQGPVPTGGRFASGDRHPPGHPRCRCALSPHISVDDL